MAFSLLVFACALVHQPHIERSRMGPHLLEYIRIQPGHSGHGRLFRSMGGAGCFTSCIGLDAARVTSVVDCTRTRQDASRAVNAAKAADSLETEAHFAVLINKLHGFFHEMTGTPCQR